MEKWNYLCEQKKLLFDGYPTDLTKEDVDFLNDPVVDYYWNIDGNKDVVDTFIEWTSKTENKYIEMTKVLIDKNKDIWTELLDIVCCFGKENVLEYFISIGAKIEDECIVLAAENGEYNVVEMLLENGTDVHAFNDEAFRFSAYNGDIKMLKLLLDYGANIHAEDEGALRFALINNKYETVLFLLANGAKKEKLTHSFIFSLYNKTNIKIINLIR